MSERPILIGRSSSHFTRVARVFAHEVAVDCQFQPILDITSIDPAQYGGNPALKLPILLDADGPLFGTENICRQLCLLSSSPSQAVWKSDVKSRLLLNAHELIEFAMAAQVQIVMAGAVSGFDPESVFLRKAREGLIGALRWLDVNLVHILHEVRQPDRVSYFEVEAFCLLEHLLFRKTMEAIPFGALQRLVVEFRGRPSALATQYCFDK